MARRTATGRARVAVKVGRKMSRRRRMARTVVVTKAIRRYVHSASP